MLYSIKRFLEHTNKISPTYVVPSINFLAFNFFFYYFQERILSICYSYGTLDDNSDDDMPPSHAEWGQRGGGADDDDWEQHDQRDESCTTNLLDTPRGHVSRWIDSANACNAGQPEEVEMETGEGRRLGLTPSTTQRNKRQARVAPLVPSWTDGEQDELEGTRSIRQTKCGVSLTFEESGSTPF